MEFCATGGRGHVDKESPYDEQTLWGISTNCRSRGVNALRWILESLTHDDELEPLGAAILGSVASEASLLESDGLREFGEQPFTPPGDGIKSRMQPTAVDAHHMANSKIPEGMTTSYLRPDSRVLVSRFKVTLIHTSDSCYII